MPPVFRFEDGSVGVLIEGVDEALSGSRDRGGQPCHEPEDRVSLVTGTSDNDMNLAYSRDSLANSVPSS